VIVSPSHKRTATRRPVFRRQCRGSSRGRLTPREVTSSVYEAIPVTSAVSSAADAALLASAISSSSGPVPCGPSPSTTTRTSRRLPAGMISTASSSRPNWARTGVSTPATWLSFIALSFDPIRPFGCGRADREASPAARVGQHTVRLRYRRRVADSDARITSVLPTQLTRRMIIGFGLAAPTLAVPWLAGCASSDPAVESPPTPGAPSPAAASSPAASPSATPVPSNPTAGPAATEQALAALAAAILAGPHRNRLSKDRRQLLRFLHNAHTAHAQAITSPLPTPAPLRITGTSLNGSLALLSRRETSAAAHYRRTALKAKGSDALLWGSLSV